MVVVSLKKCILLTYMSILFSFVRINHDSHILIWNKQLFSLSAELLRYVQFSDDPNWLFDK